MTNMIRKEGIFRLCTLTLALALLLLGLAGCGRENQREDIVILYTNDVHCAVDGDIGYAGLAAYKSWVEEKTPYVALVDCGDALQGDAIGIVSQGEYLVDIMNQVGYDFAVLGNHEFDYGMEQLTFLLEKSEAKYLGCNIRYTGEGTSAVSSLKPYEIVSYGDTDVAYVGYPPRKASQNLFPRILWISLTLLFMIFMMTAVKRCTRRYKKLWTSAGIRVRIMLSSWRIWR